MKPASLAFALIGDRYHNSDYIRTALGKTLVRDLGLTIDFTDEVTHLNAETLDRCRLLILFRDAVVWPDGYGPETYGSAAGVQAPLVSDPPLPVLQGGPVDWMTLAQGQAVKDWVEAGGAALLYHNVTYIGTNNPPFREVLRAVTRGHPPVRPYRVRITGPDHPILHGVGEFMVTDEQHYMAYDGDPDWVLMESVNEDGLDYDGWGTSCPAGWAYECGAGRVCYLAPGHNISTLWNPEYVKVQQNAVRWLRREV